MGGAHYHTCDSTLVLTALLHDLSFPGLTLFLSLLPPAASVIADSRPYGRLLAHLLLHLNKHWFLYVNVLLWSSSMPIRG